MSPLAGVGFNRPIANAQGQLIIQQMQSPNYVVNNSGWIIQKNGNAQFNQLTITGGENVQGIDLFYSPSPGVGNLVMSIAANAGTDSYGNDYLAGVTVYDTFGDAIEQTFGANVGWNFLLNGLSRNGEFNLAAVGAGTAMQGEIDISPPTGSANGAPFLTMVSESADGTQAGYILLNNSDTVQLAPQTATQVVLEYLNNVGTQTGYGAVSDTNSYKYRTGQHNILCNASGVAIFNHNCSFTPISAYVTCNSGGSGTAWMARVLSLSATQAQIAFLTSAGASIGAANADFYAVFYGT